MLTRASARMSRGAGKIGSHLRGGLCGAVSIGTGFGERTAYGV
jgi:hypothetical protein